MEGARTILEHGLHSGVGCADHEGWPLMMFHDKNFARIMPNASTEMKKKRSKI